VVQTYKKDLLLHTEFGCGPPAEKVVEKALEVGLQEIAFCDRADFVGDRLGQYLSLISELKVRYASRIRILLYLDLPVGISGDTAYVPDDPRIDYLTASASGHGAFERVAVACSADPRIEVVRTTEDSPDWPSLGVGFLVSADPKKEGLSEGTLRNAKEAGSRFGIGSNAYSLDHVGRMGYGVIRARRAHLQVGDLR
jgi:histidinol phosphatase-like PHP family hydrolase